LKFKSQTIGICCLVFISGIALATVDSLNMKSFFRQMDQVKYYTSAIHTNMELLYKLCNRHIDSDDQQKNDLQYKEKLQKYIKKGESQIQFLKNLSPSLPKKLSKVLNPYIDNVTHKLQYAKKNNACFFSERSREIGV